MEDFPTFVFLILVKLSYAYSEKLAHLSEQTVKCAGSRLILTTLFVRQHKANLKLMTSDHTQYH